MWRDLLCDSQYLNKYFKFFWSVIFYVYFILLITHKRIVSAYLPMVISHYISYVNYCVSSCSIFHQYLLFYTPLNFVKNINAIYICHLAICFVLLLGCYKYGIKSNIFLLTFPYSFLALVPCCFTYIWYPVWWGGPSAWITTA